MTACRIAPLPICEVRHLDCPRMEEAGHVRPCFFFVRFHPQARRALREAEGRTFHFRSAVPACIITGMDEQFMAQIRSKFAEN